MGQFRGETLVLCMVTEFVCEKVTIYFAEQLSFHQPRFQGLSSYLALERGTGGRESLGTRLNFQRKPIKFQTWEGMLVFMLITQKNDAQKGYAMQLNEITLAFFNNSGKQLYSGPIETYSAGAF